MPRRNFPPRYLIHFHIVHLVHELLFHFIFLLKFFECCFRCFLFLIPSK
jgi:hypothetical protein